MLVLHKDDNKTRNCPENLYYGTSAQNARDRSANGNWKPVISRGEKHGGSKLRERDIPVILSMRAGGATFRSIADSFGVADMTIQDVVKGRRWGWLTGIGGNP
jgi:hypothetical protein